jgi:hypothetical protein
MSMQNPPQFVNMQQAQPFSLNDAQAIIQLLQTRCRLDSLIEGKNVQSLLERFAAHVERTVQPQLPPDFGKRSPDTEAA